MPAEPSPTDGHLDLVLSRTIAVPRALVWRAWTDPAILPQWFAPRPWTTVACEIDLRLGGAFRTTMRSPEGQEFPSAGCILEVVHERRLAFTDALQPGFRPSEKPFFTAIVTMEDAPGGGTIYTARALHRNDADRDAHAAMGFEFGWNQCLDQLVEVMQPHRSGPA